MNKCINNLHIISNTWIKDSNELFDYESTEILKQELNINSSYSFHRNKNQIEYIERDLNETLNPVQQGETLFYINKNYNDYIFTSHTYISPSNLNLKEKPNVDKTWISLKNYRNKNNKYKGYTISQGDLIKLGRLILKIREIKIDKNNININDKSNYFKSHLNTSSINNQLETNNLKIKNKKFCRICYCDNIEVNSPLINPCKCSGGLKYIHLSCLQQWIKSNATSSTINDNYIYYVFNQIHCELCKEYFPDYVKVDNTIYSIWDFSESKFKNYICIDSLPSNGIKSIYIISFDKKNLIRIGRCHENDLKIPDVTVSRFHCQILKTSDNNFLIEDCDSKFGTLIYLNCQNLKILPFTNLPIQIGRTFLEFSIQNTCIFFYCIFFEKKNEKNDYSKINSKQIALNEVINIKEQDNDDSEDNTIKKNEKSLPKEIIIKEDQKRNIEILLNVTGDKGIDEINTLNLISSDKILKKKEN